MVQSTIISLFEDQDARTPNAIALKFGNATMSYSELNCRANCVANRLLALGVVPGSSVGVCLERSFEMVIGIIGILKAGCSYIPLDPAYPAERLAFIVSSSRMSALLLQERFTSHVSDSGLPRMFLDSDWSTIASESSENLCREIDPQAPAYVMYTSGSTGQPKGVAYPHAGLLNTLVWMQETLALTATDRILLKTPFGFDVSCWELFWPLMYGAGIVIARPGGHLDVEYLIDVIEQHAVTTINFVPSMLNLFLESEALRRCGALHRVISAGEALTPTTRDRFFARFSEAELHNIYGPTETNGITWWQCQREDTDSVVPIGRPIANSQVWILDGNGKPVGTGMIGEIYLGGVNVACGYYNRPDLTAEKFTSDPFRSEPGSRLYRTGDLGRCRADGSIEYLGRTDFQVKVRGQRIELGEIEAVLGSDPAVSEVVVLAREDTPGDQRLVAYVVPASRGTGDVATERALKSVVRTKLPDYMVPSHVVFLSSLPLSPNGKVDRKSLPVPSVDMTDDITEIEYLTSTENAVAEIWRELFRMPRIGIDQNFFDLGGHSLLALQMFSRIQAGLGVRASVSLLHQHPTVRSLAKRLVAGPGRESHRLNPIQTGGSLTPVFCVYRLDGLDMCYRELAVALGPDQPVYGLQPPTTDEGDARPETMEELAAACANDIRSFRPEGPYHLVGSSFGGVLAYEVARQLRCSGARVGLLAMMDSAAPEALRSNKPRSKIGKLFGHVQVLQKMSWRNRVDYLRVRFGMGGSGDNRQGNDEEVVEFVGALPKELTRNQEVNIRALWNYVPQPYGGNLVLYRSEERNPFRQDDDPHLWWGDLVRDDQIVDVPGDHLTILQSTHVKMLAKHVSCLIASLTTNSNFEVGSL